MVLDEDVFSKDGNLLILKAGTVLTETWIERLENFAKARGARTGRVSAFPESLVLKNLSRPIHAAPEIENITLAQSDIMIVDDNPANLRLLEDMLLQRGHEVRSFPLGRLALAAALKNPPDLISARYQYAGDERLRSVRTPQVHRELSDIPVIFLSALNETQDKVKAFRSGAVDYISKPFQFEEVHARVETHLKLHHLQQALKLQNERLEEAVAARTRELAEANERLTILDRSKNEFLNLISHEFRTPLNGLLGVGEIILDGMASTEENNELRELFEQSRRRILSILDDALLLTQIDVSGEQFRSAPVSLQRGAESRDREND